MKAVVMAGGYGTRLRPLTAKVPKPMIPVGNRPMLEHIVLLLARHGIRDILMLTYYFPEAIERHFGDGSSLGVRISYRQDPKGGLGTAGAVRNASDELEERFLVISGDVVTDMDLGEAEGFHRRLGCEATMVLARVQNPLPYGVVITDEEGRVSRFLEKPTWGEVFSDTVNTGVYILERKVLDRIPLRGPADFSKDIFPAMLEDGSPPGGYVADAYWKDVGSPTEYINVHREIAAETLQLQLPGTAATRGKGVLYLGEGCQLDPTATFSGTVVLGDGCVVEAGASLRDSFLGAGCRVGPSARLRSAVLWDRVQVGRGALLDGCVLASRTEVKYRANVEEAAIVGEDCVIGKGSLVRAGVRVWPDKVVEDEASLSTNFVWGSRWKGTLFTSGVIRGLSNREITPEFSARLGGSFGATLPENSRFSLSRGHHRAARMINRALAAGILSTGVDVCDYGVTPIPVARYQMQGQQEVGGVHVRRSPSDPEILEIRLFREGGRELSGDEQKEVDRLFFRMDFRRVPLEDSGSISFPRDGNESYDKGFLASLDREAVARSRMRVVLDYSYGSTVKVLPTLLGALDTEVVSLNSHIDEERSTRTTAEFDRAVRHTGKIVGGVRADLGALLSASGETLFLLDEKGRLLGGQKMLLLAALLQFITRPGSTVAVPLPSSRNIELLAAQHGGRVLRTPVLSASILHSAREGGAQMAGNGQGGLAFMEFQPAFDAMFSLGKLMEMLSSADASLGEMADSLPSSTLLHNIVPCPWEAKGTVMRRLVEEVGEEAKAVEGVQFRTGDDWVTLYPSSDHPCFHACVEGPVREGVEATLVEWSRRIEGMQEG